MEDKEQIGELEDIVMETEQKKKKKRNEDSLGDLWDIKHTNICIIGIPEGEEREKGQKTYLEKSRLKNSLTWERKQTLYND